MNSLKNTVVIVLLLGVSYGVFQLVNTPDLNIADEEEPVEVEIQDESDDGDYDSLDSTGMAPLPQTGSPANQRTQPLPSPDKLTDSFPKQFGGELPAQPPNFIPADLPNASSANNNQLRQEDKGTGSFQGPLDQVDPQSVANASSEYSKSSDLVDVGSPGNTNNIEGLPQNSGINILDNSDTNGFPGRLVGEQTYGNVDSGGDLDRAFPAATTMINQGNLAGALKSLSRFYHQDISASQRAELLTWLDSLAAKVIYSTDHQLTGSAYVVRDGDTWESIAAEWKVPARLVYNINRNALAGSAQLTSGMRLKQVRGPFRAEVNVATSELTVYLGDLYAGRFALDFGNDREIKAGTHQVQLKSERGQLYRSANNQPLPPGSTNNPYGQFWMDLGGGLCLHSRASQDDRGCIRVGQQDAADVFGILSENSEVKIIR